MKSTNGYLLYAVLGLVLSSCLDILPMHSKSRSSSEGTNDGKRERVLEADSLVSPTLKKKSKNEEGVNAPYPVMKVVSHLLDLDERETISHEYIDPLRLQKLLYYIQGYSLALNNCPLFQESIVHFTYGPLVWEVLEKFKGRERLTKKDLPEHMYDSEFTEDERSLIKTVFQLKMLKRGSDLVTDTHNEKPYQETNTREVMSPQVIKNYFQEIDLWMPYVIHQFMHVKTNVEFANLVRYVREYISYGRYSLQALEGIMGYFERHKPHLEEAIACWTDIVQVRWPNQNYFQAFMGHIFFPVQLEHSYEPGVNESLHGQICISGSYGHVYALLEAAQLLKLYVGEEDRVKKDEIAQWEQKVSAQMDSFAKAEHLPHYFVGLLYQSLNQFKKSQDHFRKGFEQQKHALAGYRYIIAEKNDVTRTQLIEELKKLHEGLAVLAHAQFEKIIETRIKMNIHAGKWGIPLGYYNAGLLLEATNPEESNDMYLLAARNHFLRAFEKLAQLYQKDSCQEELEKIYKGWGEAGAFEGYIKLGELLLRQGRKKEGSNYFKCAGIRGIEKNIAEAETFEQREMSKKELKQYMDYRYDILKATLS